ncbi:hypothetical protein FRX31_002675 [Thalictrum thalictroides]|uniref:Uncharacterized protein n=1 Tax=Thalictrum thalictroides TaxID=46969 RepID=A0A7J6XFI9_THATH|nr:hypothetical protein FRX31_002675 [Thalictrum thalictroides]
MPDFSKLIYQYKEWRCFNQLERYRGTTQAVAEGYAFATSVLDNATLIEGDITKGTGSFTGKAHDNALTEGNLVTKGMSNDSVSTRKGVKALDTCRVWIQHRTST